MLEDHRKAFATLKNALANATLLHHLTENSLLSLTTDVSASAMGAAVHEVTDNSSRPIAFFSRRLTAAERNYSTLTRNSSLISQRQHSSNILLKTPYRSFHRPQTNQKLISSNPEQHQQPPTVSTNFSTS